MAGALAPARLFMVGVVTRPGDEPLAVHYNALSEAAVESVAAYETDRSAHFSVMPGSRRKAPRSSGAASRRSRAAPG
jgi:hypothetical protein